MEKKKKKKKNFADIFARYKTYDTSDGFGDSEKWKQSFKKRMGDGEKEPDIKYFTECDTLKELSVKHKQLMKQYHPDVAGNTEDNNRISQEINQEYKILLKKLK